MGRYDNGELKLRKNLPQIMIVRILMWEKVTPLKRFFPFANKFRAMQSD